MKTLYNVALIKGSRTFSFEIAKSGNDELYLAITECKKGSLNSEKYQVIVFEEYAADFIASVNDAFAKLQELKAYRPSRGKAYSIQDVRQTYKQAYAPWTVEDDKQLEDLFGKGKSLSELALLFKRKQGAIHSRLKKLGLQNK